MNSESPKYNVGDVVWRTLDAEQLWWGAKDKPASSAYDAKVTAVIDKHDVNSSVWYVCTVYTYLDNYFFLLPENCLFKTEQEAIDDSKKRYDRYIKWRAEVNQRAEEYKQALKEKTDVPEQ